MDQSPFWTFLERLRASTRSHDDDAIEEILTELDTGFDTIGAAWPEGFIEELEKLLKDPHFMNLTNSWKLLYFINNNLGTTLRRGPEASESSRNRHFR
jgi:hypothetical protein